MDLTIGAKRICNSRSDLQKFIAFNNLYGNCNRRTFACLFGLFTAIASSVYVAFSDVLF